jgi:cyclic pyranopterin phosphate synthase
MPKKKRLTHLDRRGRARMVDVSAKEPTLRKARASATVRMKQATLKLILRGGIAKGDVFGAARFAGIIAAKQTPRLIPLCHPIAITAIDVDVRPAGRDKVEIFAEVTARDVTGVEMEALTAAAVAALTLYDMCKSVDRSMEISRIVLLEKSGGRSGTYRRAK